MKNGQVMTMGSARAKVASGLFWPIDGHFSQVFEIWTSNLFCPVFTSTLIYKPSLKSIRPKLAILSQKKLQKLTKVAISQNPILPKCHSPKSLLLLHFSMNLSETFRIDVNLSPKSKKSRAFFGFLAQNF